MRRVWRVGIPVLLVAVCCSGCRFIVRASVNNAGVGGNFASGWSAPAVSGNGRYVAFNSSATNLVPGDTNGYDDVFVRDNTLHTTKRVSVGLGGAQANGNSDSVSISSTGRYVVFESGASNLVAGTHPAGGIYVRDVQTNKTTFVVANTTGHFNVSHLSPSISGNGRYVVFTTQVVDQVGGTPGSTDVDRRDLRTAKTTRVSVNASSGADNGSSGLASISADGRYVAFQSDASDLVSGDSGRDADVFVRDMQASRTTRISVDTSGAEPNGDSSTPSISGNGRYVAFSSTATDLVPHSTVAAPGVPQVFVRDRKPGTTEQVSVDTAGRDPNGPSGFIPDTYFGGPSISSDGRLVAFSSSATNLVAGDENGTDDVFVRDPATRTTTLVSTNSTGEQANGISGGPEISSDGSRVAFKSQATNLDGTDSNNDWDVFVRTL